VCAGAAPAPIGDDDAPVRRSLELALAAKPKARCGGGAAPAGKRLARMLAAVGHAVG